MNNVISALCGTVNFMPPWIMLGVFGAIILLIVLFIAFKGIKRGVKFIILGLILMAGAYLAYLCVQIALWDDLTEQITFAISWLPTVLFVFIVMTATFINAKRGLRKSLILALHAVCAGAVAVAFFFIMVGIEEVDAGVLNFINFFMGGEGALQRALGVDESLTTFKEVLAAYVPVMFGADSDIGIILQDNTAYIYTVVDMVFRIVIAVFALLIHLSLEFILYIVYILCYSQRKYKKNRIAEFRNGKTDRGYRKHHIGGGVVGLVRGAAVGLLCLSFLGSAFFVVAGGKGEGELEDYDFGDENLNFYYQIYRSIDGYGSQGIFKILNEMSDATDTPYYLFAADLIFSGELDDEEAGISDNIKLREELAALTGFAHDTLELFMKYGSDELNALVGGEVTDTAFDTVVEVMTRTGFKEEFDALIDAFDTQTYIINLSMSLVNSVVSHIDDISFTANVIGEGEKELIKLIFKEGFLTENIPDERDLIAATGKTEAEGENIRPYITVKHILNKDDVKTVLNVVLSVLAGEETGDTLKLAKRIVPELGKLSILSTERKDEFNPVLGRMYCLFENLYLTDDGEDGIAYSEIANSDVDWIDEINTLLSVCEDSITLYNNVFADGGEALDIVKKLFNKNDKNYEENMRIYDGLCTFLTDSRVLGRALSTSFVYRTLYDALKGVSENIYIPRDLAFGNTYGENGEVVKYGETYLLLSGVRLLCYSENNVLDTLLSLSDGAEITDVLDTLADAVALTDKDGNTMSFYLTDSKILRALISVELIEASKSGNTFYVPKAALENAEGDPVNLIVKGELVQLLDNMGKLVEFVMPFVGESTEWETEVDGFINDEDFYSLVKTNRIFEGTVAQLLNLKLADVLTVPAAIKGDVEGWITVDGKQGELVNLVDALRVANFKVSDILLDNDGSFDESSVLDSIMAMSKEDLNTFFGSSVLHYTVSDYIIGDGEKVTVGDDFVIIVPVIARQYLEGDVIESLVKKNELISAFNEISALNLSEEGGADISKILVKLANDKGILTDSNIISASIVATMVQNAEIADDLLAIPQTLKDMGSSNNLKYFDSTNPWTKELPALVDALDELLGLQGKGDDYVFDEEELSANVSALLTTLNDASGIYPAQTRLGVLYNSLVFRNKITVEIDGALDGKNLVDSFVINYAKLDGYYTFEELQALSDAAKALDITSLDDLQNAQNVGADSLEVVYRSYLAQGIITKKVQETLNDPANEDICDHPFAYKKELAVYKYSEVETLLNLYGNLDAGEINTENVSGYVYDKETGETKSYILVASLSSQLLVNSGLIIPDTVYDSENAIIQPYELMLAIDAFNAIKEDLGLENLEGWTEETPISIPEKSVREVVFASQIIRARITFQLVKLNADSEQALAVSESEVKVVYDVRKGDLGGVYRSMLSAEQLEYFAGAMEIINGKGTKFEVPEVTMVGIFSVYDNLDEIFKSDIMRYRVCEYLAENHIPMDTESAFDLSTRQPVTVHTATAEEVKSLLHVP